MSSHPRIRSSLNEISLRGLLQTLCVSKWWMVFTTLLITCIAAAYAFLITPVYEASVYTLPPTASGLASYNAGSQLTGAAISGMLNADTSAGIKELSTEEAYKAFLLHLTSNTVRQQFFDKFYLPAHDGKTGGITEQKLRNQLDREIVIKLPNKEGQFGAKLTFQGKSPEITAKWANSYVDIAIDNTRKDLLDDLAGEVQVRKIGISDQINTIRVVAEGTRKDRITRLQNALNIAESIGLEMPFTGSPLISVGSRNKETLTEDKLMYLSGAKALHSEIAQLKKRNNDDAYIPGLTDLLKKQTLLNNIDLNPARMSVAIIDRAAIVPEEPVKPKKVLTVILGLILGALLGIFVALLRRAIK